MSFIILNGIAGYLLCFNQKSLLIELENLITFFTSQYEYLMIVFLNNHKSLCLAAV